MDRDINQAFLELREEFPFGKEYVEHKRDKYRLIATQVTRMCPAGAEVLSVGSGPCDLEAILCKLGFKITAIDDLNDQWHVIGNNRQRIIDFAEKLGMRFLMQPMNGGALQQDFDAALLIDVIEHMHDSPRALLNYTLSSLKPNGLLIIETPNAIALHKRLRLLFGKTPLVDANFIYWNVGEFRSHVREYSPSELRRILSNHYLDTVQITTNNLMFNEESAGAFNVLKKLYNFATALSPNFKDSTLILAKKPVDWRPTQASIAEFKKYNAHIMNYNLDGESDESIAEEILTSYSTKKN
jgi:2-polyprenyl-3-methyl-5-hydroxy-6-metoxy-1,4-benzoquinol methylase